MPFLMHTLHISLQINFISHKGPVLSPPPSKLKRAPEFHLHTGTKGATERRLESFFLFEQQTQQSKERPAWAAGSNYDKAGLTLVYLWLVVPTAAVRAEKVSQQ